MIKLLTKSMIMLIMMMLLMVIAELHAPRVGGAP